MMGDLAAEEDEVVAPGPKLRKGTCVEVYIRMAFSIVGDNNARHIPACVFCRWSLRKSREWLMALRHVVH